MSKIHSYLLFIVILVSSCSPKGFVFDGKKLQQIQVADVGDLYSTYNFSKEDQTQLSSSFSNTSLVSDIEAYSKEKNWPAAINTLEKRLQVRPTMLQYHFYKVATLGNKTIVALPADKNRHMPAGFVPATTIYMVFASKTIISK